MGDWAPGPVNERVTWLGGSYLTTRLPVLCCLCFCTAGYPNDADFWVGGGDFLVEGDWRWIMKNQVIDPHVTYWAPGEPDNGGGPQGCLRISAALNYKWESGDCDSVEYAVCEQP